MELVHEFDETAHIKKKGLPILIDLLEVLNRDENGCIAGIFGEQLLIYHTDMNTDQKLNENLYEMFVFYDNTSVYGHNDMVSGIGIDGNDDNPNIEEENIHEIHYTTISNNYKSDLFGLISSGFQALCDALNDSESTSGQSNSQTYALRKDTMLESKWNYFTSSITVEIYRESDNLNVFYCEFGQIHSVDYFKRLFLYENIKLSGMSSIEEIELSDMSSIEEIEERLVSYFLNFDGFVFTFFFTMNKLKFTKGILFFQECQKFIKAAILKHGGDIHAAQNYLIRLFLHDYNSIFNIFIPVAFRIPDRPLMYMKIYESTQAEILHELFSLFDAEVQGFGYREPLYKDFCSELNQDLLKTIGSNHPVFGGHCTGSGILSIYQILAYYTNALNECMEHYGCIAQESGGDASTHYMSEEEANKVYISDVDIKFFFDSGRSEGDVGYNTVPGDHKGKIVHSLHWLIHFFNEHEYLKMNKEIANIRFGGEVFVFSIDSMNQRKRFRIRALEQWKDIAALFSLDARLKIRFVRHGGHGDVLSGKIDLAFFDIACIDVATKVTDTGGHKSVLYFKNNTSLSHSKLLEIWREMKMPALQDYDFPGVYKTVSGEFRLMPIPSLKNALLESIELTGEERMVQRIAVNKHEKDLFRKRQFMKLFVSLLNSKVGYNIGNGNVSDATLNEIDDDKLLEYLNGSGSWFSRGNNFRFKQLPVEQLAQICSLEQVDIETRFDNLVRFREMKDGVINNLRTIFNGGMVPGALSNMTAEFIQNLENSSSHRYKLSYSYVFQKDDLNFKSVHDDQAIVEEATKATVSKKQPKSSKKTKKGGKKGGKYTRKNGRKLKKTRRI